MPQQPRTSKQVFMLILAILKFLGAVMFIGLGAIIIVAGSSPDMTAALEEGLADSMSPAEISQFLEMSAIVGGIIIAFGVGGIVHGIMDIKASKPMGGSVPAIVFAVLALLFDIYLVVTGGLSGMTIILPVLNAVRLVLAILINGDNKAMMMGAMPGAGMPMQGGYPQQGYGQPGMPPQGYGQPGMPQQGGYDPNAGYDQNGGYDNYGNGGF